MYSNSIDCLLNDLYNYNIFFTSHNDRIITG